MFKKFLFFALVFLFLPNIGWSQAITTSPTPPVDNSEEEVVRIGTNLIQTGVSVYDKKGAFVKDLKKEDFELRVNGKPVSVSFFEAVAGQPPVVQPTATNPATTNARPTPESAIVRGRIIVFVVDDIHLDGETSTLTRRMLANFIEKEKQPDDLVAIVSTTGKIGFLQQFTTDPVVLRAAAEKVVFSHDYTVRDPEVPPMSEYEALLIDRYDKEVTEKFLQTVNKSSAVTGAPPNDEDAELTKLRQRARLILAQTNSITARTYDALGQAVRATGELPGRKTIVFVSNGFILDTQGSNASLRLQRIVDSAARSNTVIYSIDAKGLEAGFPDSTTNSLRVQSGQRFETIDGMFNLADSTGGKLIQNTNNLFEGVTKILDETSRYYLLAWEPEAEETDTEKFRKIEIKIRDRPELKVSTQNGYLTAARKKSGDAPKNANKNVADTKSTVPEQALGNALTGKFPVRQLPTSMIINYLDLPNEGGTIAGAVKIDGGAVEMAAEADKKIGNVELAGAIYDADGKRQDYFRKLLTIESKVSETDKKSPTNFYYNFQNRLKPGLYQIRIAVRDTKSGRVGSNIQWIEVPDLASGKPALSSLLISERSDKTNQKALVNESLKASEDTAVNVDRIFERSAFLRYIVFIYNSRNQKSSNKPSITVKTTLSRGKDVILSTPETPVSTESQDLERLFYGAELPLKMLAPGKYRLSLTVTDANAKAISKRDVFFEVR